MAVEQGAVQELPFTIEPLSSKRVQLWSRFAGRAETETEMWIVRDVFYAFWWEVRAQDTLQRVFVCNQFLREQSEVGSFVGWLDVLIGELMTLRNVYGGLLTRMIEYGVSDVRYYKDIEARRGVVVAVLGVACQYGTMLCSQWSFVLPENLAQETSSPTVPAVGEGGESL